MNPNIAANQQRLFLGFLEEIRPHLRRDSSFPRRLKEIFARNRALGSRDRKLYRELIYTYLRYLPWIDPLLDGARNEQSLLDRDPALAAKLIAWLAPDLKPTAPYRAAHCGDWPAVPDSLAEKAALLNSLLGGARPPDALTATRPEDGFHPSAISDLPSSFMPAALLPAWFRPHCPAVFEPPHLDALNRRANIWVRLQATERSLVLDEFRARGWPGEPVADFPEAVCLPPNAEVAVTDAYRRGFVEIQDLGSQMVLALAAPAVGGRWLDACAGAGGKSLQLARLLGPGGHVDATDIRLEILDELRDRAQRARIENIKIVAAPAGPYDGVLVDAPCSGTGTWRRQPHLKWYLKPESIAVFAATQLEILSANATLVKPGGLLIYATCSLSHVENQDVVATFLQAHPEFRAEPPSNTYGANHDGLGTTLLPGTRNTDGFYVARLRLQPVR